MELIRVAVFDDNDDRRQSLEMMLNLSEGTCCAGTFSNCAEVLNSIRLSDPMLVLMDIEMPEVGGIEGVRLIKQHYPGIKVIMQTVFEDEEKIFAALQAGAEGYILKNAGVDKLLQSIHEVYNGGAFMTPTVALRVMRYFNTMPAQTPVGTALTLKEKEVLKLLTEGLSYKMVADRLSISYYTVNTHVKRIYDKLQVHSIGEAISVALKNRIV